MTPNKILEELEHYKNVNKEELMNQYIQERLSTSLSTYYKELSKSLNYLYGKDNMRLLRKINRGM